MAALAGARELPRSPVALDPATLCARAQGPHLRADRGDGRRIDDLASGDAGRGAELGLPLHVDQGRELHALEPARDRLRRGGAAVHGVRLASLPRSWSRDADHVRDRGRDGVDGEDARPPGRIHRFKARPGRERRLQTAPERRLRRPPRLDLHPHEDAGGRPGGDAPDRLRTGGGGRRCLAGARPGHLGGTRRAEALRVVQAHVLGGAGPRGSARGGPGPPGDGRSLAPGGGRRSGRRARAGGQRPGRVPSALRDRRARCLAAPHPAG